MYDIKDLNNLRLQLPRGWRNQIAEATGYTPTYVGYVLNGKRSGNSKIIEEAKKILRLEKERVRELKTLLKDKTE